MERTIRNNQINTNKRACFAGIINTNPPKKPLLGHACVAQFSWVRNAHFHFGLY